MASSRTNDASFSTTRLVTKEKPETLLFLPEGEGRHGEGGLRTQGCFKKSYDGKPLISIITVVYNGEKYLEETIQSVINQTYDNVEYIIIDGGSTDRTLDIIRKYENKIDYWVSEKDSGIYDAMNKGLMKSTGKYIGILNADDFYEPYAVAESLETIMQSGADYSISNVQFATSKFIISPIYPLATGYVYQDMPYPHISAFISKKIYDEVGSFDAKYKIAGDHDMALRIHLRGYKAIYLNRIIGKLTEGGVSDSLSATEESRNIAISYGKNSFYAYQDYYIYVIKYYVVKFFPISIVTLLLKLKKSRFKRES